ncbi:MAG TPA: hypothetical protein VFB27_08630 [Opitutaceae bacterium]|nr:hypothetical protein [Opitutaceae bacterium]
MDYFAAIRLAIRRDHKCIALHSQTVPVKVVIDGKVRWEGNVEVYDLIGHLAAKRCYAWGVPTETGEEWEITTALAVPPATPPEGIVKAALAAKAGPRAV